MCSHETVTWEITDNCVTNRMIDNSLIHKLRPSRKIRRRTKALNAEIRKHCRMEDYRHYIELKTNVLRNLAHDTDTDASSSLSDVDYDIIYSSPLKRAKYVAKNSARYIFTSEEEREGYKKSVKVKSRGRNTERKVKTRKLPQVKCTKKRIDIGWQEVTKKSSSAPHLRTSILDNEEMVLKDNDFCHFMAESGKQSLSPQLHSQNSTSEIIKYRNEHVRQNHEDTNAMDTKLSSENNRISNKTKSVCERKAQSNKNQNMNESNTTFSSHDSHHQSSLSQSILENSSDFDSETNTLVQSEDNNSNKLTSSESSINTKNSDNTYPNHKSELLKNVKRNLVLTLEKIDSRNYNKDIETRKSLEDKLNNDQLRPTTISFDQHSTPLLRNTGPNMPEINDLSPDISLLDHQKDSGIDEDSQDGIIKIKRSNEIATSCNTEENAEKRFVSPELTKNDEVIETAKDCKETEKNAHLKFSNDILRDQISEEEQEPSREEKMRNSSQTIQSDINIDINREDKEDEHFAKTEHSNNIQNQQLLYPKQDCTKNDAHSEHFSHIQKEDRRKVRKSFEEEEEISLALNKINTEVSSINCEGEAKRQADKDKEEKNFPQLNKTDKDEKTHLINQEDKICMNPENTHDVQKQQILPKIMHTEILNKKYKIINKKDNNVKNDIEIIDSINISTDITNKCTAMEKNTLIHCPDVINHNTDDWQDAAINAEEIDAPIIALETDNEEINVSYVSPQTKKRLQQQARLNLVVSDSSESDNEYLTTKTSRQHIYTSDTSCSEDDRNDETNHAIKQTDISHNENIYITKEAIVPTEVAKLESANMKEGIKKKAESLIKCTYENNDLIQSTANENLLKKTQYCENVHNDNRSKDDIQLRVSESNVSCNKEESVTQVEGHKQSLLLHRKNMYTKSNANEEIVRTEFGTRHTSEHEQSLQASTNFVSNTHLNISYEYRPCNLQELVEDQGLLVETMPANFTLADLSEDEEAFILNVPSKVIHCDLQDQVLTLKKKSIKFGKSKYRIVRKEVGTTSCIFATAKKRKPYKIINIKKISTITVREKLPQDSRNTEVSKSYRTVSSVLKPIKMNNQQTGEADSKIMEVLNHEKHKRRESSGSETEYL